jgi:hypothetical protein
MGANTTGCRVAADPYQVIEHDQNRSAREHEPTSVSICNVGRVSV